MICDHVAFTHTERAHTHTLEVAMSHLFARVCESGEDHDWNRCTNKSLTSYMCQLVSKAPMYYFFMLD